MANVINMGGGGASVQSKTVKSTTTQQTISPPSGVDGFAPVIVSPIVLQEKTVTPSTSQQVLTPPSGVDGFSKVVVEAASSYKVYSEEITPSSGSTGVNIPAHGITTLVALIMKREAGTSGASTQTLCYLSGDGSFAFGTSIEGYGSNAYSLSLNHSNDAIYLNIAGAATEFSGAYDVTIIGSSS